MSWESLGSIATAIGVAVAAYQIRESIKLSQTTFEDSLDQQYRAICKNIPVDALIGKEVSSEFKNTVREEIYNYLDLCNEQIFLRSEKRVSKAKWSNWCIGIKENLNKVEFLHVWSEVKEKAPASLSFLEKLREDRLLTNWSIVLA